MIVEIAEPKTNIETGEFVVLTMQRVANKGFRFREAEHVCAYGSDGYHILTDAGECRCGRRFVIFGSIA